MSVATLTGIWPDGGPDLAPGLPQNTAVQVDWPRGQDGSIDLILVDRDGQPVDLDIAGGDSATLTIRQDFFSDALATVTGTRTSTALFSFALASNSTIDFSGFLLYDIWCKKGGVQRQVVGCSYFQVTPRIATP